MPRRNRPVPARCELGVTGKQVRRALPLIAAPPSFRDALRQELAGREPGGGVRATSATDATPRTP